MKKDIFAQESIFSEWQRINDELSNNIVLRVKNKLFLAQQVDQNCEGFGSDSHQYQVKSKLSLKSVDALQIQLNCQLPTDYVQFITEIGNGGAGPYYGLVSLDQAVNKYDKYSINLPCLLSPDMTAEEWQTLCYLDDDCSDEEFEEVENKIHQGMIYLGTCGCTYDLMLVVNGSYSGRIVYTHDWSDDLPPYQFSYEHSFLEWYERWLDEVILGYNTSWFGHRMGGDENALILFYQNTDDILKKIDGINGFMKLPNISSDAIQFLEQELLSNEASLENNQLSLSILNVLGKFAPNHITELLIKYLEGGYDSVESSLLTIIYRTQKEYLPKFKNIVLEVLGNTEQPESISFIGYILTELKSVRIEYFYHLFTHINSNVATTAIYAASHDKALSTKVHLLFKFVNSDDSRVSLQAIQVIAQTNKFYLDVLPYLENAWQNYPTDPYIRDNITRYMQKFGKKSEKLK